MLPAGQTDELGAPQLTLDQINAAIRALGGDPNAPLNIPTIGAAELVEKIPIKQYIGKTFGGILRYPYEALTDNTDYLQIDIRTYNSVASIVTENIGSGGENRPNIVSGGRSIRKNDPRIAKSDLNKLSGGKLQTKKLKSGKGTILLPMPSNIQDGNSVSFSSGNLDGITAEIYGSANSMMNFNYDPSKKENYIAQLSTHLGSNVSRLVNDLVNDNNIKRIILNDLAAQAANVPLGGSLTRDAVFARTRGEILNQNVELLFNGVTLRSFKFSFKLTPRNEDEALQIKLIINAFKQNMAAKSGGIDGTGNGTFLGTPNVFELFYKRGNTRHPFLHSFKQCVLTEMSVNYTGEGTYATYGGDLSAPVSMVLELGFKELEPIYDTDYGSEPGVGY